MQVWNVVYEWSWQTGSRLADEPLFGNFLSIRAHVELEAWSVVLADFLLVLALQLHADSALVIAYRVALVWRILVSKPAVFRLHSDWNSNWLFYLLALFKVLLYYDRRVNAILVLFSSCGGRVWFFIWIGSFIYWQLFPSLCRSIKALKVVLVCHIWRSSFMLELFPLVNASHPSWWISCAALLNVNVQELTWPIV